MSLFPSLSPRGAVDRQGLPQCNVMGHILYACCSVLLFGATFYCFVGYHDQSWGATLRAEARARGNYRLDTGGHR